MVGVPYVQVLIPALFDPLLYSRSGRWPLSLWLPSQLAATRFTDPSFTDDAFHRPRFTDELVSPTARFTGELGSPTTRFTDEAVKRVSPTGSSEP